MKNKNERPAMDFWGRLELYQDQLKMPLKVLCLKAGVPYQTTLNQKSNAQLPSLRNACLLAKTLGCSVEWLFFGDEKRIIDNCNSLAQSLFNDKRLFAIANRLSSMTQEELYSLEIILNIRG